MDLKTELTPEIIKTMKGNNISVDLDWTKKFMKEIWHNKALPLKHMAVELGGYPNTKSFSPAKGTGRISLRMVIAIAIALNVDPLYIIGRNKTEKPDDCTNENLREILKLHSFLDLVEVKNKAITDKSKDSIHNVSDKLFEISKIMDNVSNSSSDLTLDELEALIKSIFILGKRDSNSVSAMKLKIISEILVL